MKLFTLSTFMFCSALLFAQSGEKMIEHDIYDTYKTNKSTQISNDGNWFVWTESAEVGNPKTIVQHTKLGARHVLESSESPKFFHSSDYLVFKKAADYFEVRKAKLDGKKGDKLPKDSLGILNLKNGEIEILSEYSKFSYPEMADLNIIAWVGDHIKGEADTTEADKKRKGNDLNIHLLDQNTTYTYAWVAKEMEFSEDGSSLVFFHEEVDSIQDPAVVKFDTKSMDTMLLHTGNKYYNSAAVSKTAKYIAFRTSEDTLKEDKVLFNLVVFENGKLKTTFDDSNLTAGKSIRFSENEEYMMWSFEELVKTYKDDSLLSTEWPDLNIWKWDASYIPTLQENRFKSAANPRYKFTYLKSGKTSDIPYFEYTSPSSPYKMRNDVVFIEDYANYGAENMADYPGISDLAVFFPKSQKLKPILTAEKISYTSFSPNGKYIVWFDMKAQEWYSYNVSSERIQNISRNIPFSMSDELHDTPSDPYPYGYAGFLDNDRYMLIYDRYDIWVVDLNNPSKTYPLTNGRKNSISYRIQDLDREELELSEDELYYLAFDENTKGESFGKINKLSKDFDLTEYKYCDCNLSGLMKAKNATVFTFSKSDFRMFPDYYVVTGKDWKKARRMSETGKQLEEYQWGTVEATEWMLNDRKYDGLIYKPQDFDSTKKYPMIVYYYERYSDRIHQFWHPTPSRSIINPTIYTSQGYVIFIPDIYYKTGQPGQDAYDAIMSGTDHMLSMGYIDESNMGLQGQSWGGYQTAYMVTRTGRYAAAMAGAPVSNMTSAYGGIRWGSGLNRSFQYEHTQSRLGTTMWEDRETYIKNSPLFFVDQVTTPLLIMHNDEDGAVPWYQGIEMFIAMRRLSKPSWLLQYKGDDHNLLKWDNRKDLSRRMLDFFDHYLKESDMPEWMDKGRPVRYENSELRY